MQSGLEAALGARFARFARLARPRANSLIAASLVFALFSIAYAGTHLGIEGDNTKLLSEDLPFRRLYAEFERSFPILDNALLVVVDAPTSLAAHEATQALAARLRDDSAHVQSVHVPFGGEFFQRHGLLYLTTDELEELSLQLIRVQPVLGVLSHDPSLRGMADVIAPALGDISAVEEFHVPIDVPIEELFDKAAQATRSIFSRGNRRLVSWEQIVLGGSFPGNPDRRILIVQPELDFDSVLPARKPIAAVRQSALELGLQEAHGVAVRITGNQALNYEEMLAILQQTLVATALSFLVVAGILAFAIGSLVAVLHILVTLVVGLSCTALFAALVVGHVNMVSLTCAVLFVGLGVDFAIHLVLRYGEERRTWSSAEALESTVQHAGPALLLCAVSTAIGFYAFIPTDYKAVAELGLISGTGMFISFALSLTLLPALLTWWPPRHPLRQARHRALGARVSELPRRYAGRFVAAAALVAVVALALLPGVRFDSNLVSLRDPTTESARTFQDLLATAETSPWNIDVVRRDEAGARATAASLAELPVVDRALTLADFVPDEQDEKLALLEETSFLLNLPVRVVNHNPPDLAERRSAVSRMRNGLATSDATRGGPLAKSAQRFAFELERVQARAEASSNPGGIYLELEHALLGDMRRQLERLSLVLTPPRVTREDLPEAVVDDMRAIGGAERVRVFPAGDLGKPGALEHFVDQVRTVAPEATGSAVSLIEWRRATIRSFQQALVLSLALITLLLWVRWRSLGDTLLVLAPLGLAAITTAATAVVLGMQFNFINVVVIPLLLGIGVDSGIHLVERSREGLSSAQLLLQSTTARAVFYSSLTTAGSFGTLALASHRGLASMGVLLMLGLLYALAANLLLLPALIELRGRHRARRAC